MPKPGTLTVCFYFGTSPVCEAVRWDTRKPGQPFANVPSHVAVVISGRLSEMVAGGFHTRAAVSADYAVSCDVPVSDMIAALNAVNDCRNARYGWLTDAIIALCRCLPDRFFRSTRGMKQNNCSWLVKYVLQATSYRFPLRLRAQFMPCTPNDIWLTLKTDIAESRLAESRFAENEPAGK